MDSLDSYVFGTLDYAFFVILLLVSLIIGLYFGFWGGGSKTTNQFLYGGKQLKVIPVAISLISSQLSGAVLVLFPAEVYGFGTQNYMMCLMMPFVTAILYKIFIPVFFKAEVSNAFEYLELRFDWRISKLASFIFVITVYTIIPIFSFISAIGFSQVTGVNAHVINGIVTTICVIYTMLGGIKAVIWTDVVQAAVMVLSCLILAIYGIYNVGGLGTVFERASSGGRLILFNMSPSLTERHTFWNQALFQLTYWSSYLGLSQVCVQRLLSVPSLMDAKRAVIIFGGGIMFLTTLNTLIGLVLYATFYKCDPLTAGIISKPDKLVPYFVTSTIGHLTGLTGIFIAAIFSASLSTISAQMNTMSGIIYEDFVRKWNLFEHTEFRAKLIMKVTIVVTGVSCFLGGFIVDKAPHIFQMSTSVAGVTVGITGGVFTLGMLTPWANSKGALFGAITSLAFLSWIATGSQIAINNGLIIQERLQTSTEGCTNLSLINNTFSKLLTEPISEIHEEPFVLYKLSFNNFAPAGLLIVWVVGLIVSFLTGPADPRKLGKNVYASCIHWMLPKDMLHKVPNADEDINIKKGDDFENNLRKKEELELEPLRG